MVHAARKDSSERSDYDVAVAATGMLDTEWSRWALELREKIPTLCGLDLVRLDQSPSKDLAAKIRKDGVEIYVRQ